MTTIHYENLQFVVENENLMFRLREPNLNLVVSYLRTDGSTMDEYSLYRFEWKDDQWLVHVNIPLLEKQIEYAIELYTENLGSKEAEGVPMDDLVYRTIRDLCEAHEALETHQCEETLRAPQHPPSSGDVS
jgi:hypothetical protein